MSNQRKANYQSKPDQPSSEMAIMKFFKEASRQLISEGKEDEAFYFEQMVDWLQSGKKLPTDEQGVTKALGI
jgi:hypothetical protein